MKTISFVVPVWNEAENIEYFVKSVLSQKPRRYQFELIFVLDPCTDDTETILKRLQANNASIKSITMSRRFGQPMCILCGLQYSSGEAVIIMDCDMQDPPELIPLMLKAWEDGFNIVLPRRIKRYGESKIKKLITYVGYKLIDRYSELEMPRNVSDFRLISRKVVDYLNSMNEAHGFIRGMVAYVGFSKTYIDFVRPARHDGLSKYNARLGSLKIGGNGVFAYSSLALNYLFKGGIILSLIWMTIGLSYLISKAYGLHYPIGNPSILISLYMVGSFIMLGLAIVGQYLERIYEETRNRPRYIIGETSGFDLPDSRPE